ncbi:Wat1-related protein, partial [Thalictrum thalictroides]
MEKLDLRTRSSQAKTLGTIVSITGAIIVTLYKGQAIHQLVLPSPKSTWVIGGLLLTADWLLISVRNIVQTAIVKEYPAELTITFFYCLFSTVQSAIFTLIAERDLSVWRLKPDVKLIAVVYAAIFGSVLANLVHAWCLRIKGPIYVSIFKPFGIVVAVIMSVTILREALYMGSVLGSIVISLGFYGVIWGKSKEEKVFEDKSIS